jgi:hypothetical protein
LVCKWLRQAPAVLLLLWLGCYFSPARAFPAFAFTDDFSTPNFLAFSFWFTAAGFCPHSWALAFSYRFSVSGSVFSCLFGNGPDSYEQNYRYYH